MATITKFEDLEISQLARIQANDFDKLVETTVLAKDFELRNQCILGSIMDCIAEGFERPGNSEFKTFRLLPKAQMENSGRSYTGVLTENISSRKNSMNYILKMLPLEIS